MELSLNQSPASHYKSKAQIARVLTEKWFLDNGYCPACPSDALSQTPANEKVVDFRCPDCASSYQLKAKGHRLGGSVANGAYQPKIEMIRNGTAPNWFFMEYDRKDWTVENVMLVPAHFVTPEIVQRRNPLRPTARRAGWVGSSVLIARLPLDARIPIILDGQEIPRADVRKSFQRFEFLKNKSLESKGWLADVLACVRELPREFSLNDIYAFEGKLAKLHPGNRNVRPKIRQQLQILRDNGILEFVSPGKYRFF
ncbi:MAG: restriction endonuclease [Euryarchaeota archaeon]|nr:restriction endonuclease [Euryarchaeota archaeon]